jgi:DNA-binding NarL/FixJ family response regulator
MSEPTRIVVADDHPLMREGVVTRLNQEEDMVVVGEASSGREALEMVHSLHPDIVVADLTMPDGGGIEVTKAVASRSPATFVLILTVSEDPDDLLAALKEGAHGYVLKGVSGSGLVHAVRSVLAGEVYVTRDLAARILQEMSSPAPADPLERLTARERDILGLLASGLTNREIGERLFISEKTVKHYMTGVLRKLHVRSRVEAALLAQRRALGDNENSPR